VPTATLLAARDSLAQETSRLLRQWLGQEVRLREQRNATRDVEAWSLVQRADRLRRDGEVRVDGESHAGHRLFDQADSLLALAESRDGKWSEPIVIRARIALRRARASAQNSDANRWLGIGLAHAERALRNTPRSPDALEVRGTLRFERYARNLAANTLEEKALLRGAEADLLQATEINPAQASAWNALSVLDYRKLDLANANIHARRALEEDAFLAVANDVLWRLFATSYDLGDAPQATRWCAEGRRRFSTEARFAQCRLYVGLMNEQKPDVEDAWRTVHEVVNRTPPARRQLAERQARMLAAAALARTGLADSARAVLLSARAEREVDPQRALLWTEALVRVRLGDHAEAIRLLKLYLTEFPQHRAGHHRNTWWWKDLDTIPEYKALIGSTR
jgi:tetratricopeptide (TPR) repeat protein